MRRILRIFGVLALCVVVNTTLFFASTTHAASGINQTLSFQGRLLNSAGNVVPDGTYNMQFKIYQDGDGQEAGDTGGALDWTESYINNGGATGVQVVNGFFSVNLGSQNPFGTQVDWNQDTLWLSMNVAGTGASCSTFGGTGCSADGEMAPMKRITATPYALNAGMLGGRDASGFIQNSTSTQTGDFNISGTGIANIIQGISSVNTPLLDSDASGVLSIGTVTASTIDIGTNDGDHSISIGTGSGTQNLTIGSTSSTSLTVVQGSGSSVQLGDSGATISSGGIDLITAHDNGGNANVGIGNDASSGYALDVTGDVNSSTQYRIGGTTALTDSSLSFSGAGTSTITSAGDQMLSVQGSTGVTVESGTTTSATFGANNVQIGTGLGGTGAPVFLTLDNASAAPSGSAPIGSMYYDTAKDAIQCYTSTGWGSCTDTPDTFISLAPSYTNAVVQGTGNGSMTTGICSDSLHINDGTNSQPDICGTNETYNFYNWTSSQTSSQTDHIYVSYQLPANFSNFVAGSTSLMGRTDDANSSVKYQLYRKSASGGLTACGTSTSVSTGAQTSWQKGSASGDADPSSCSFAAGDTLFVDITTNAQSAANAYVSNLNFAYSGTH